MVRDTFINDLTSYQIRRRLLESNNLTVDLAFNRIRSLQQALEHSAACASYETQNDLAATSAALNEGNCDISDVSFNQVIAAASSDGKKCYFCGRANHRCSNCPAKNQLFATYVERLAIFLAFVGARVLRFPRKFRPDKLTHYHPTVQTPCVRPMQRRVLVAWPRPQ